MNVVVTDVPKVMYFDETSIAEAAAANSVGRGGCPAADDNCDVLGISPIAGDTCAQRTKRFHGWG